MSVAKRKIAVVTGSRAEYGLFYWLLKAIQEDSELELQLVVTAMHLSPECGLTVDRIIEDGFKVSKRVELLLSSDSKVGISKSVGLGVIGFADAFADLQPDVVVVLGDRYEILAAAQAAMLASIPIAHIHGGETSQGAVDEGIRHSISKMSQIHFVAANSYRNRLIQMGEDPNSIFNFGGPGLDHISKTKIYGKEELEKILDYKFGKINFVVTFHPATLASADPGSEVQELLKALSMFPEAKVIFTYPNREVDSNKIIEKIEDYLRENPGKGMCVISMGFQKYLSAVANSDVVIGNSSSGLIEVPFLKTSTVNIGLRQKGRLQAKSVFSCNADANSIADSISKAMDFNDFDDGDLSPYSYGFGESSNVIKEKLKTINISGILIKKFYDFNEEIIENSYEKEL